MLVPLDRQILQEIVRIVQTEQRVPAFVEVDGQRYVLMYLEDHDRRLQEAIANRDTNLLSMLFGQLASRVKYQVMPLPAAPSRRAAVGKGRPSTGRAKLRQAKPAKATGRAKREVARQSRASKQTGRGRVAKKQAKVVTKRASRTAKKSK